VIRRRARGSCRERVLAAICALAVLALGAVAATRTPAARSSAGSLQQGIDAARAREQALSANAAGASHVIATLTRQLEVLSGRVADVQAQLNDARVRLGALQARTAAERVHAAELARRFVAQRAVLRGWLVAQYEQGPPDAITVLLNANGFADLLERIDFLRRIGQEDSAITDGTLHARDAARLAATQLAALTARQARETAAVQAESQALARMSSVLDARRALMARARAVALAELRATRAHRISLQQELDSLVATPFGAPPAGTSFAIPWPIVECESGGQNLPPNSAGASGYYQILPSTWSQYGGSGPAAYLAPKSEQDAVASRLWNGGAGASNWVCAGIVGIG
jgi:peptidoglycan hydrolase CwlO-like protein